MREWRATDVEHTEISPEAAAAEVARTTRQVRRRARWPGWMWATIGVVIFGFTIAANSGDRLLTDVVGPLPAIVGVGGYLFASRQRVVGRGGLGRIDKQLSYVFLALVVAGTVIELTVLPQGPTAWLVLLAAVMVVPCGIGVWRWLRL